MPTSTLTAVRPGFTTSETTAIFPSATPYDRPTSHDNYLCTVSSPRRRPRATAHEIYPDRSSAIRASQLPARHTASPPRRSQPSSSQGRPNHSCQHTASHTGHKDPISDFTSLQTLSTLKPSRVYTC